MPRRSGSKVVRNKNDKKCFNKKKGKECVYFDGKRYYTPKELYQSGYVESIREARDYFKNKKTRIIVDENNNILKIDLQNKINATLKEKLGLTYVRKKQILEGEIIKDNKEYLVNNYVKDDKILHKVYVQIILTAPDFSEPISLDSYVNNFNENEFNFDRKDGNINVGDKSFIFRNISKFYRNISGSQIQTRILDDVKKYCKKFPNVYKIVNGNPIYLNRNYYEYDYKVYDSYKEGVIRFEDNKLYDQNPLEFEEWNVININGNYGCVSNSLIKKLPNIDKNEILSLEDKNKGIKVKDIVKLLYKYNVNFILYNGKGEIYKKNYGFDTNNVIYGVAHNNHFYLLKGKTMKKRVNIHKTVEIIDATDEFIKIVENGYVPSRVKLSPGFKVSKPKKIIKELVEDEKTGEIKEIESTYEFRNIGPVRVDSFVSNNIEYIQKNNSLIKCGLILEYFDIDIKIKNNLNINNIFHVLDKELKESNTFSFFPNSHNIMHKDYNYRNKEIKECNEENLQCIDKNKAYTYALYSLDFLIVCDWRKANKKIYENEEIVEHFLYHVKPKFRTIIFECEGLYTGSTIIKYRDICEIEIISYIETEFVENHYKQIIDGLIDLWKHDIIKENEFKDMINRAIGTFSKVNGRKSDKIKYKFLNISNKNFQNTNSCHYEKLCDNLYLGYESSQVLESPSNRMPISIQVKEKSRIIIYEKIKELMDKDNNLKVLQVKVDSISFISNNKELSNIEKKEYDITGWKKSIHSDYFEKEDENKFPGLFFENKNDNELYLKYAGTGKTYLIKNKIIKKIEKTGKKYMILTPSHKSLLEFIGDENLKDKCDVIQTYTLQKKYPDCEVIIIDEVGMIDRDGHNLIYNCTKMGYKIIALGDFYQLLPFGEENPFNDENYIKYMFNKIHSYDKFDTNYRNKFKLSYYEKLINSEDNSYLIKQVNKYSTREFWEAKVIVSYRKSTRDKYNELMLKYWHVKKRYDIGTKHIVKNKDFIEDGLVNNDFIEIIDVENKIYKVKNLRNNKIHFIPEKKMKSKRKFNLGYAINIHQFQSGETESYYWCKDDNKFIDGRNAYVIISRLKNK